MDQISKDQIAKDQIAKDQIVKDEIAKIGLYQIENLIANQVPFLFFYLRAPGEAEIHESDQAEGFLTEVLKNSVKVEADRFLDFIFEKKLREFDPIVLFSETAATSEKAARDLADKRFINTYVLELESKDP
jgi:hypothetical protein